MQSVYNIAFTLTFFSMLTFWIAILCSHFGWQLMTSEQLFYGLIILAAISLPIHLLISPQKDAQLHTPKFIPDALIAIAAIVVFGSVPYFMIANYYKYPHMPIKQKGSVYQDKKGTRYSEAEYNKYSVDINNMLASFGIAVIFGVSLIPTGSKRKD